MAFYPSRLWNPVQLGTSITVGTSTGRLYAPGAGKVVIIKQILLANDTATARTVSIYMVPSGGAADDSTIVTPAITVPPNTLYTLDLSQVMGWLQEAAAAGDGLYGKASAASAITCHGSGIVIF